MSVILASGSPRRRELMEMLRVPGLEIIPARGEEHPPAHATPEETVEAFEQLARGMTWSKALYAVLLFLFCLAVMKTVTTLIDRTMGEG